ncbi:Uncharacterised protein [Bordetella pertussis]|nr:Uncharacterised protein [Bordetella pertussis]CFL87563.1 Uncharacterised protein [Bordetella pertussis]CFN02471.1 Uncharacterised protein [Bordetella pertussis]CFN46289.1 Uncharacterised protein [Bordetella pertussis]CFN56596.1 Uncharacterised protein [Bordetella pertussis]
MLAPVLHPLDRAAQLARGGGNRHFLGINHELGAEPAAHVGRHHAQAVLGLAQHQGQRVMQFVGHLGRGPHGQRVGGAVHARQHAAPFHGMRAAPMHPEIVFQHPVRLRESRLAVAIGQRVLLQNVRRELAAHQRRIGPQRIAAIHHRAQHFIFDRHPRRRVLGDVAAVGHHHRDGLADERHLALGQHERRRVIGQRRQREPQRHAPGRQLAEQVARPIDRGHARHRAGGRQVDRDKARMGMRATHEAGMQHALDLDIVQEARLAAQQRIVLDTGRAAAQSGACRISHDRPPRASAAPRAAPRPRCSDTRCSGTGGPRARRAPAPHRD